MPTPRILATIACGWILAIGAAAAADIENPTDCHVGIYRLADGSDVDINGAEDGKLRWRRKDGRVGTLTHAGAADGARWTSTLGWTAHPDGVSVELPPCDTQRLVFNGVVGHRLELSVTTTRFAVEDAQLAGRLVLPKGAARVPLVVLVHGSEHESALQDYALQRLFPSAGIGVFVYDKRGTGESSGTYTQDYLTLAADAVAAMREAKRLARGRIGRVGYQGGSQGGWVAPLAARVEPVDFVIVSFGLAVSPLAEDRSAIALDITRHGFGALELGQAMEIADATAGIWNSGFRDGYEQLDAVRDKYRNEAWFPFVRGNITWFLLEKPHAEVREAGPKLLAGVPIHYDPMPVLRNLGMPQLWLLGADDLDAPSAETARRLRQLARDGRPIRVTVFPHTEHGLFEYETQPDGTRLSTRQPADYFSEMTDFILGTPAGAARTHTHPRHTS